jgi:hypothetical protein
MSKKPEEGNENKSKPDQINREKQEDTPLDAF